MNDLILDYNFLLAEMVGEEHGIRETDLNYVRKRAGRFARDVSRKRKAGELGFFGLPYDRAGQERILAEADRVRKRFRNLVVLGLGGSSLGTKALHQALNPKEYNVYPRKGCPRLFLLDNIDPRAMADVIEILDPDETAVNVVSKSGVTTETLAQYLVCKGWLEEALGESAKEHFYFTTDPDQGPLREIAAREGHHAFPVPTDVSGRFSVLSPVGLFPAACVGIEIAAICEGAAHMYERCRVDVMEENPGLMYAALMYLMDLRRKKNIQVIFSYSTRLAGLADWTVELMAESLGKKLDEEGKEVYSGPTPVKAVGVTDQHSQAQLFIEGPNNKVFTFLKVEDHGAKLFVPPGLEQGDDFSYLANHPLSEILESERVGMELALKEAERPSCLLTLPDISPQSVGQYITLMEFAVTIMSRYYKVDPFNQPGAEVSRNKAMSLLGREGLLEKRDEIVESLDKDAMFRI